MKRYVSIIITLLIGTSLAGCGSKVVKESEKASTQNKTEVVNPKKESAVNASSLESNIKWLSTQYDKVDGLND